jgi:hypothetical protein
MVSDDLWERGSGHDASEPRGAVDLYWIPLGAGAHVVRVSGKLFASPRGERPPVTYDTC